MLCARKYHLSTEAEKDATEKSGREAFFFGKACS